MFQLTVDVSKIGYWEAKDLTKYRLSFNGGQLQVFSKKKDLDGRTVDVTIDVGFDGKQNYLRVQL